MGFEIELVIFRAELVRFGIYEGMAFMFWVAVMVSSVGRGGFLAFHIILMFLMIRSAVRGWIILQFGLGLVRLSQAIKLVGSPSELGWGDKIVCVG